MRSAVRHIGKLHVCFYWHPWDGFAPWARWGKTGPGLALEGPKYRPLFHERVDPEKKRVLVEWRGWRIVHLEPILAHVDTLLSEISVPYVPFAAWAPEEPSLAQIVRPIEDGLDWSDSTRTDPLSVEDLHRLADRLGAPRPQPFLRPAIDAMEAARFAALSRAEWPPDPATDRRNKAMMEAVRLQGLTMTDQDIADRKAPRATDDRNGMHSFRFGESYGEYCARAEKAGLLPQSWQAWWLIVWGIPYQ